MGKTCNIRIDDIEDLPGVSFHICVARALSDFLNAFDPDEIVYLPLFDVFLGIKTRLPE